MVFLGGGGWGGLKNFSLALQHKCCLQHIVYLHLYLACLPFSSFVSLNLDIDSTLELDPPKDFGEGPAAMRNVSPLQVISRAIVFVDRTNSINLHHSVCGTSYWMQVP